MGQLLELVKETQFFADPDRVVLVKGIPDLNGMPLVEKQYWYGQRWIPWEYMTLDEKVWRLKDHEGEIWVRKTLNNDGV